MSQEQPRENVYVCQKCGGLTVTVDVDEGVTPFMIGCRAGVREQFGNTKARIKRSCDGDAYSSFYPTGPRPAHIPKPAWEWYKPTDQELAARYKGDILKAMREHVAKGGLDMRRRTDRQPVMHKAKAAEA